MASIDGLEELPGDLAEQAADRLLAANEATRAGVLAELIAMHPDRAVALRSLCADLDSLERLLDTGYRATDAPPSHIGGYRVLRRLGEGAFGIVYLCAQEHPVVRQVAIKVLRPGAGDPKTLQRFAGERQLLAQLNHPGITQVYDAGDLPDGRPFFVMEYVDGTPIHEWCMARDLPCADRLRLFADLGRAVAHAHARGIVHRDLKPANVLVVATSDGPVPKVIDFGIAKAIGGSDDGEPRTEAGRVIGTPGYMSPEQAAGRVDQVDARTDVFALGVMLYQLLTDQMPWAGNSTTNATEPVRPSARVATNSGATRTSTPRLAARLRGDLDWITLAAIARDRDERYPSVAAFVADIERHLRGESVSVGPPSPGYRLRKFVRRRRAAVIAAAAIAIAGIGTTISLTYASRMSADAGDARRDVAAGLADSRETVARLLQRADDPALFGTAHGDEVRRALGSEALAFTDRLLATRSDDPALLNDRCDALLVVAEVQRLLGEPRQSASVASQAVGIALKLLDAAPSDLARRGRLGCAMREEARAIAMAGDHATAHDRYGAAIGHLEACAAADTTTWRLPLAVAIGEMASVSPDRDRGDAIAAFQRALTLFEGIRQDAGSHTTTQAGYVKAMLGLSRILLAENRLAEAQAQVDRVAGELATLGHQRLESTIDFHRLRGKIASARGGRASAIADYEAAANAADELCRTQPRRNAAHRLRVATLDELGNATNYGGDFAASSALYRRAIAAAEAAVAQFPDDPTTRSQLCARHHNFAYVLWERFLLQPLAEAADHVARAFELDALLGDAKIAGRMPRWMLQLLGAQIETSRGGPDAATMWRDVENLVPIDAVSNLGFQLAACTGIARMRLLAGEADVATQWLGRARAIADAHSIDKKFLVEIEWRQANIALRANDPAAAVAAANRIVEARPSWLGFRRAADCLRLAALCNGDLPNADAHRERAREFYRRTVALLDADVGKHPDDPWFVIPWGAARVRLAEFAAAGNDTASALDLVDTALARLDAARPETHHDQWDEDAYRAGQALRDRLRQ